MSEPIKRDITLIWISSVLPGNLLSISTCALPYTIPPVVTSLWSSVLSSSHTLCPSETELLSQSQLPFLQRLQHGHSSCQLELDHPLPLPMCQPSCALGSHTHPKAEPALFHFIENTNRAVFLFGCYSRTLGVMTTFPKFTRPHYLISY